MDRSSTLLAERGVIEVAGADRGAFLQGLVSNDVTKVAADRAIYAALLTAQGKYLHDFFIAARGEALLIDAEAARLPDLLRRLSLYKLRAKVTLADRSSDYAVAAAFGADALGALGLPPEPGKATLFDDGIAYVDPRLAALGARLMLPRAAGIAPLAAAGFRTVEADIYDRLRLGLGIPDGSRDLPVEKALLLECGFDELNGIDWQKGCYVGQELTARTKYRALVRKRLLPVAIEGPLPSPGTPVMVGGEEAGEIRSGRDGMALALLRLEMLESTAGAPLTAGATRLTPKKPDWAKF